MKFITLLSSKMAQSVKALSAKPDDLNSVFGIHMVEGKNQSPKLPSDLYMAPWYVHTHRHTHIHTTGNELLKLFS